jgi:hypothetical protein
MNLRVPIKGTVHFSYAQVPHSNSNKNGNKSLEKESTRCVEAQRCARPETSCNVQNRLGEKRFLATEYPAALYSSFSAQTSLILDTRKCNRLYSETTGSGMPYSRVNLSSLAL